MTDLTALSYWFPLIKAAGLPVPETRIVKMPTDCQDDLWQAFDGKDGSGALKLFADQLASIGEELGYPLFLRTDFTSCKHDWNKTCYVSKREDVLAHIYNIAEKSELMDMMGGLKWDTWVLRELLPTTHKAVCPRYGDMPVCREFRLFVEGGEVKCFHPYWPEESLKQGGVKTDYELIAEMGLQGPDELAHLTALAVKVSNAVPGAWSVDILETQRGWFVTDMAEAHKSFHWENCPVSFKENTNG